MPSLGTNLERLVIPLDVLLDQALETDVLANFAPDQATLEDEEQPRDSSVSIPERVNTEEVEAERSERDQRMDPPFLQASVPALDQPLNGLRRFGGGNRPEANARGTVDIALDDVAVPRLELAGIADTRPGDPVEILNRAR